MSIVTTASFVGAYKISTDNFSGLSDYISLYEPMYLRDVLGDENADELNGMSPLTTKYDELINGVTYTNESGYKKINKGLKTVLIAMIYFHYVADNFINTSVGNVRKANENSDRLTAGENAQTCVTKHNLGAMLTESDIRPFLTNYNTIKETASNSVDNAGEYTVSIASTKFLTAGDVIEIDGIEYTTTTVNEDVSVVFTTTAGLDFTGKEVKWQPFFGCNGNLIDIMTI